MGNPRWLRILPITAGSSIAAMSVKGPLHCGQVVMSRAFVAQGRARDVATQPFEFLALMADLALREVPALGVWCDNLTYGK